MDQVMKCADKLLLKLFILPKKRYFWQDIWQNVEGRKSCRRQRPTQQPLQKFPWKPYFAQPLLNSYFSEHITKKILAYLVLGFIKKLLKHKFDKFEAQTLIWLLIVIVNITSFIFRGWGEIRNIPLGKGIFRMEQQVFLQF